MLKRIYGLYLRYLYGTIRSWDRLTDFIYWPIIDLALWGVTGAYIERSSGGELQVLAPLIFAIILWYAVYRTQGDLTIGFLDELWNKNLINIYSSPVGISEQLIAAILFSFTKLILATSFAAFLAGLVFDLNFLTIGWALAPFLLLLTMFGWSIGLTTIGLLLRYTTRIQSIAWTAIWLFAPFSLIYFPREMLHGWALDLSLLIPASYVFEEMRRLVSGAPLEWSNLLTALCLNTVYLSGAIWFCGRSFRVALQRGLVKIF